MYLHFNNNGNKICYSKDSAMEGCDSILFKEDRFENGKKKYEGGFYYDSLDDVQRKNDDEGRNEYKYINGEIKINIISKADHALNLTKNNKIALLSKYYNTNCSKIKLSYNIYTFEEEVDVFQKYLSSNLLSANKNFRFSMFSPYNNIVLFNLTSKNCSNILDIIRYKAGLYWLVHKKHIENIKSLDSINEIDKYDFTQTVLIEGDKHALPDDYGFIHIDISSYNLEQLSA